MHLSCEYCLNISIPNSYQLFFQMQMDPFEDINMAVDSEQHRRRASEKEVSSGLFML